MHHLAVERSRCGCEVRRGPKLSTGVWLAIPCLVSQSSPTVRIASEWFCHLVEVILCQDNCLIRGDHLFRTVACPGLRFRVAFDFGFESECPNPFSELSTCPFIWHSNHEVDQHRFGHVGPVTRHTSECISVRILRIRHHRIHFGQRLIYRMTLLLATRLDLSKVSKNSSGSWAQA